MVAPRKKTSGFSEKPPEKTQEEVEIDAFIDAVTDGIFQNLEKEEEVAPAPTPVVIESIIPTEDSGPRFAVEIPPEKKESKKPVLLEVPNETVTRVVKAAPVPAAEASTPVVHPPKRNPRNIPRFSRYKKA